MAPIMYAVAVIADHAATIVAAEAVTTGAVATANARGGGHPAAKMHVGQETRHARRAAKVRVASSTLGAMTNRTAKSRLPMAHITMHAVNAAAVTKAANATRMRVKTTARNLQ